MSQHNGPQIPTASMVLYHDIDDYSGTSSWSSKTGPNASVQGTTNHRETTNRQYLELDGSTGYVELDSYLEAFSNITINAWISCDVVSSEVVICSLNNMVLSINQNSGDSSLVDIIWYPNYSSSSKTYAGVTVSRRSHTLVSVTQDSSGNVKFYINGELKSSQSGAASLGNTQAYKHIGSLGGSSKFFKGAISRLIVNNKVLSHIDISKIYKTNPNLLQTKTYTTSGQKFVGVYNTYVAGTKFARWQIGYNGYQTTIDWGDGSIESLNSADASAGFEHTYEQDGEYVVSASGDFLFNWYGGRTSPGRLGWTKLLHSSISMSYVALYALKNLVYIPSGLNDSNGGAIFAGCENLNHPNIQYMTFDNPGCLSSSFTNCYNLNQPMPSFTNQTSLYKTFYGCHEFNQPLDHWNTENITSLVGTFQDCRRFNQPLDSWTTSGVTSMNSTFRGCSSFNQDLSSWDTSSVTSMASMFYQAYSFDSDISSWDVSNVTDMSNMFYQARNFGTSGEIDLSNWDISNVTNFASMFLYLEPITSPYFNINIDNWSFGPANLSNMCRGCRFNRDTSGWDVSQVTNMNLIFYGNYGWFTGRGVHTWNLAGLNASNALDNFCYTTTLPTGQYDLILNNWNTNKASGVNGIGDWRNDLRPHFGSSKYTSAGSDARQALIDYGWTITDGGLQT